MRVPLALLAVGLVAVVAGAAWWSTTGRSTGNRVGPVLDCPEVIDLGEQERGQVAIARATLANAGDADLTITDVRSSCSCAGLEIEEGGT